MTDDELEIKIFEFVIGFPIQRLFSNALPSPLNRYRGGRVTTIQATRFDQIINSLARASSRSGQDLYANGLRNQDRLSRCLEASGHRIDAKDRKVVALLICYDEVRARRIKCEASRKLATAQRLTLQLKASRVRIDAKDGDTVVSPVGTEQEFPIRMHLNVGGIALSLKIGRQSGSGVERLQSPRFLIERERGDCVVKFIDGIGEQAVRMEREVPRSRAQPHPCERRIVQRHLCPRGVEAVHEQPVEAQVGRNGEAIPRSDVNGMRLRFSFRILAFALMLDDGRCVAESPVRPKRQARHTRRATVRNNETLPLAVDPNIAGAAPAGLRTPPVGRNVPSTPLRGLKIAQKIPSPSFRL